MIDSLLTIAVILAVIVGTGALAGSLRVQSAGAKQSSRWIIVVSTIAGVLLAGIVFWLGLQAWLLLHRWAGVRHTMFVIETLSSLAVAAICGWFTARWFSRREHRKLVASDR
jgi:peptidoglycan biosynthesis protein MviN/MurJ (putative lipid II flippase)